MSFTSQRFSTGQQAQGARSFPSLALVSESEINWQSIAIGQNTVGNRCWPCGWPGSAGFGERGGSKPSGKTPAQKQVSMKNARKAIGDSVSDKRQVNDSLVNYNPEDRNLFENPIFTESPAPRKPESPEVELLRSLLKANLTSEKASPALMQRIRSRMHEHKE